ncbi:hypothetical protein PUNSTDRAFT_57259 [Punctularia strigosozonata HHB-11173 SS5]|uniref:uncharacterized protein n=1 Tax=Punctularia strigosozonata (strain HHB-11173) TaxID=741275 RepID=UPI000441689D|nr:uncharacterized protein PUNSTDRAFT_57259 [Punctularia strigosozonata HHB-11173 SS5]EIN13812.1 hypothetical protein PUNSTDRAFT_57259 [Punctularia strigosozonata HHB-11173 SS5]
MATSMAAAVAASLPAAPQAPAPAAPVLEQIPASMSKAVDPEAEIPISYAQLDGLVVSKIIKHASEARSATGLLLGLDLDGVLEVSNSFPLPTQHTSSEEDDKSSKAIARYQGSMLRSLKEVQADDSVVGFYQATTMGAFYTQTLMETQAIYQEKLRHGGVVIVHDITQSTKGNASFKAFKLSKAFIDAHKRKNFSSASLANHRLTFSSILQEIPLKIRTNALLSSFISRLSQPTSTSSTGPVANLEPAAVPSSYQVLSLDSTTIRQPLSRLIDALDAYKTEENNLAYLSRQIAREKAKAEGLLQKRRDENAVRQAQGLQPLPEADVQRLVKVPPEPSRLESMLLIGQVDAYAKTLEGGASAGLVKMYGTKADAAV